MDDWELWVHDAKTGAPVERVEPVESSWSTSIAGDGQSTETFVVNDAEQPWQPGELAGLFEPNDRLIARWWGGEAVLAQKIDDWDYDRDRGTVTVHTVDLLGEAEWRLIGGVHGGHGPLVPPLTISNRSASGAIRAVLARMMQWNTGWGYPVDLPPDGPGAISGEWPFWMKHRISEIIQQIEDQSGAELFLRPYAVAGGGIRFQAHVAEPITIGASAFNLDAAESPLAGVHYRVDGKRQVTGVLGLGNGSGQDQETKWAGASGGLIPVRDTKHSFPDLTGAALQGAVNAYVAANTGPIVQWSVGTFTIGDGWLPEHAAPGRVWEIESYGDPVIPDGVHMLRVIKVSGGNGRQLTVEVQDAAA